ncbi:MAG: helix-turn-helix transcriptional regulator [Mangrovibacterium sp.]
MMPEEIYEKMRERRQLLRITQRELSDISGVALRTIKMVESGKCNPSMSTLHGMLAVLGMTLEAKVK